MRDCKLCSEPVSDDDAVEVEAAGMPDQTAVFHEVCWDNYESDFVQREADVPTGPRWERKPKPGTR
jgi:hypothetical protein